MRYSLFLGITALTVAVWVFAVIGVMTVTRGAATLPSSPTPMPLLAPPAEVLGADIVGLPPYEGADRSEYRQEQFGDSLVTEIEYIADARSRAVRAHYESVFEANGWAILGMDVERREWVYTISNGERQGIVEIEPAVGGGVEIEIELSEPATERYPTTYR